MMSARPFRHLGAATAVVLATACAAAAQSFVNFESGHVRPVALSPDGNRLFAVNTPDNRLAIYDITTGGLTLAAEVSVGLEPVAVATRTNAASRTEAWVVNHLSDSVSIVEVDPADATASRVTRTLLVGDEPRDIIFAGTGDGRAFVTCAHRGQNRPGDPQLTTEGIGRADLWAFNVNSLGAALGGTPIGGAPLVLFADTPRALAKSPDGSTVYVAAFNSGTQTTTVLEGIVTGFGGLPPPPAGTTAPSPRPSTGLIVKFDPMSGQWRDEIARDWSAQVVFDLPDLDVFLVNANANPPALAGGANSVANVGSTIFSMAVNPQNAKVYVGHLKARNEVRFEPELQANLAQSHITVITGTTPLDVHLNPHIVYGQPGTPAEAEQSLAFPVSLAVSGDGATAYVAAFGSGKVGILDASDLEAGTITEDQVDVGLGPSGLALDEARDRLYVMNRIDHTISVVSNLSDPMTRGETAVIPLRFDPEPPAIRDGRRFLYDARNTSGHGDQACASCHIFGDLDALAWDLGDPMGVNDTNFNPFRAGGPSGPFHPMKGPMTTQSLRGMADAGPMHWRGDRSGATFGGDPQALNEDLAFKEFNPAFVGLLGRSAQLLPAEMQAFTDFILTLRYPPNPIRALDNQPTPSQTNGENLFLTNPTDGGLITCNFCHRVPLGTDGLSSIEGEPQEFKIPHLRNIYQKVGMFGLPAAVAGSGLQPTGDVGDQIRGFGYLHDGGIPTINDFVSANLFQGLDDFQQRDLEAFLLAFDTGLRPAVGQQVSATPATVNSSTVNDRIDLLIARADAGDCELVVKGIIDTLPRGAQYVGGGQFQLDRNLDPLMSATALRALAATAGQELTYTCVPPGSGRRIGIDRDGDNVLDRTELDDGTDPADPSDPGGVTTTTTITSNTTTTTVVATLRLIRTSSLTLKDDVTSPINPNGRLLSFRSVTKRDPAANDIVVPARGSAGDPTFGGADLVVRNSAGLTPDDFVATLPAAGWSVIGAATAPKGYRFASATGPIQRVTLKNHRLVIRGGRAAFGYTLDEAAQGSVALRLRLGTGNSWCTDAGAPKTDRAGKFKVKNAPAPPACP
jgi:DNA-binding beta-propeller fold protein YncE